MRGAGSDHAKHCVGRFSTAVGCSDVRDSGCSDLHDHTHSWTHSTRARTVHSSSRAKDSSTYCLHSTATESGRNRVWAGGLRNFSRTSWPIILESRPSLCAVLPAGVRFRDNTSNISSLSDESTPSERLVLSNRSSNDPSSSPDFSPVSIGCNCPCIRSQNSSAFFLLFVSFSSSSAVVRLTSRKRRPRRETTLSPDLFPLRVASSSL